MTLDIILIIQENETFFQMHKSAMEKTHLKGRRKVCQKCD